MAIFLFILFFNFFNFTYSIVNKESSISYNYLKEASSIIDCADFMSGELTLNDWICLLEGTKNDPDTTLMIITQSKDFVKMQIQDFLNKKNMTILNSVVDDIFSENSTFIDDVFDLIRKNGTFIDYIINIVKILNTTTIGTDEVFLIIRNAYYIINMDGIDKITSFLLTPDHNIVFLYLIEKLADQNSTMFSFLEPFIREYKDIFINAVYEILKHSYDEDGKERVVDIIKAAFLENKNISEFFYSVNLTDNRINLIKNEILQDKKFVEGFLDLLKQGEMIRKIVVLFINLKNNTYIQDELPNLLSYIYELDSGFIQPLLDVATNILEKLIEDDSVSNFVSNKFTKILNDNFFRTEFEKYSISEECKNFMQTIFFKNFKDDPSINQTEKIYIDKAVNDMRHFFLRKILIDTTKDKNDFSTYENCLNKEFDNTQLKNLSLNFTIQPIYVIGIFDDTTNKSNFNDSIFLEKYNYILSYCLPYGIFNNSNDKEICSQTDYGNLIKIFLEIPFNMNTSRVDSFYIYERTFDSKEYYPCILTIFLLVIPILISFFLYIYDKISFYRYLQKEQRGKIEKINELSFDKENETENEMDNQNQSKLTMKIKRKNYKLITPMWYKYLNEYFSLIKNGLELFDFKSKESIVNNVNGLTYIKGLLGTSMILYVFGQTFIVLYNLPFKNFTLSEFNKSLKNPLYVIPFIGLRYSPRVILSCSGYTLMYKFLCFIEKEKNLYLPKFFLIQSYKYILLILVVLFMRYSFYYVNIAFNDTKRPMLEILKYILEYHYDNSFEIFFKFLINYFGDFTLQWKQNLIQYFYLPINEVFLFIVSTILISIGYKFKLKIDIAIIIIVAIIFILKILFFVLYSYNHQKYPTLYFYLYDYGGFMLNPFYNLPSFFIGMFFGLINYSVQRGVNLFSNQSYQRIYSIANKEESFSINEPEQDNEEQLIKKGTMLTDNAYGPNIIELNNYDYINSNNMYYQQQQESENSRSFSQDIAKLTKSKKKKKKKKEKTDSHKNTNNFSFSVSQKSGEYNQKIKDMPFLIFPTKFLNFHRQNGDRIYFKIIVFFFVLLIIFFSCVQFIYVGKYSLINTDKDSDKEILEKLSFKKMITNYFLNFIYVIDIDLVVLMINWGFFILYSKGYKTADIYDFFNNNFWSFFIKCYFSFIIFSSPIILIIFYQSETVVKFTLLNVILFSLINLIIIFLFVIILYSIYEMPFKKIFKSFLIKEEILNDNLDDEEYESDEYYQIEEKKTFKN